MIRAILFDSFGVLVGKSFRDVYRAAGGNPVRDEVFISSMIEKTNRGFIDSEAFAVVMADRLGLTLPAYKEVVAREEQPHRELLDYIRIALKPHYKLAIVSNAAAGELQRRLSADDLALFDTVIASAEVGFAKPDREIFALATDRLGVSFAECIFIDDLAIFTGPAADMGMTSIQYHGLDLLKKRLAELLLQ